MNISYLYHKIGTTEAVWQAHTHTLSRLYMKYKLINWTYNKLDNNRATYDIPEQPWETPSRMIGIANVYIYSHKSSPFYKHTE